MATVGGATVRSVLMSVPWVRAYMTNVVRPWLMCDAEVVAGARVPAPGFVLGGLGGATVGGIFGMLSAVPDGMPYYQRNSFGVRQTATFAARGALVGAFAPITVPPLALYYACVGPRARQ